MITLSQKYKVCELMEWATQKLQAKNNSSSRTETELMLSFLLRCQRIDLYLNGMETVPGRIHARFRKFIVERCRGVPLQYLTRETYFYGLKFFVDQGVFIPRPETEVLVELIIDLSKRLFKNPLRILELCTGCGNIAVALTKHRDDCTIKATDIDQKSLKLAKKNARWHGVQNRITFLQGDLYPVQDKAHQGGQFEIIIANPPYLTRDELGRLPPEVRREPRSALDGGVDGLMFFKRIVSLCGTYLKKRGLLAFESAAGQQRQIAMILKSGGVFGAPQYFADLNGMQRFIIAKKVA